MFSGIEICSYWVTLLGREYRLTSTLCVEKSGISEFIVFLKCVSS